MSLLCIKSHIGCLVLPRCLRDCSFFLAEENTDECNNGAGEGDAGGPSSISSTEGSANECGDGEDENNNETEPANESSHDLYYSEYEIAA